MKLILAIVNTDDSTMVQRGLSEAGFFSTKLATTGGFLRAKNSTFLIGTEADLVDEAIDIISKYSKERLQILPTAGAFTAGLFDTASATEVRIGGATIFVLDVEEFRKL